MQCFYGTLRLLSEVWRVKSYQYAWLDVPVSLKNHLHGIYIDISHDVLLQTVHSSAPMLECTINANSHLFIRLSVPLATLVVLQSTPYW